MADLGVIGMRVHVLFFYFFFKISLKMISFRNNKNVNGQLKTNVYIFLKNKIKILYTT